MKRWVLKAGVTTLDGLVLEDAPLPIPRPGEVRIRMQALSLNARDYMIVSLSGFRSSQDIIPLSDGAGEIDALGDGVEDWRVGDPAMTIYFRGWHDGPPTESKGFGLGSASEDGVAAEYVVLPADRVTRPPQSLSLAESATLPCAGVTAWNALRKAKPLDEGGKLLVLGTGGVSLLGLVIGRAFGARLFATTSDDSRRDALRGLGVQDIVNYKNQADWGHVIHERSGGIDKVLNSAGTGSINQSLIALAPGGEVAVAGYKDAGEAIDGRELMTKEASIRGIAVGSRTDSDNFSRAIDERGIKPPIGQTFAFDQLKEAYQMLDAAHIFGKIVVTL